MPLLYNYTYNQLLNGTLSLINQGSMPFSLGTLIFITNGNININNMSAYSGTLLQAGTVFTKTVIDIANYRYQLNQPSSGLVFNPGEIKQLQYRADNVYGPLQIMMDPVSLSASSSQNPTQLIAIDIVGKCQGNDCNDPNPNFRLVSQIPLDYYSHLQLSTLSQYKTDSIIVDDMIYLDEAGNFEFNYMSKYAEIFVTLSMLNKQYPYQKWGFSILAGYGVDRVATNQTARNLFINQVEASLLSVQQKSLVLYFYSPWMYLNLNESMYATKIILQALYNRPSKQNYELSTIISGLEENIWEVYQNDSSIFESIYDAADYIIVYTKFSNMVDRWYSDFASPLVLLNQDPNSILYNASVNSTVNLLQRLTNGKVNRYLPMLSTVVEEEHVFSNENNCLWQPISGRSWHTTNYDFYNNVSNKYGHIPSDTIICDPSNDPIALAAGTSYAYSLSEGFFYTLESNASAAFKGQYILDRGLGGAVIDELQADMPPDSPLSIIRTLSLISLRPSPSQSPIPSSSPSSSPSMTWSTSASGSLTASPSVSKIPFSENNSAILSLGLGLGFGLGFPLLAAILVILYCWKKHSISTSATLFQNARLAQADNASQALLERQP